MLIQILMAALIPMVKVAAYSFPTFGLMFGESAKAYEDERFNYIKPIDLGSVPYTEGI